MVTTCGTLNLWRPFLLEWRCDVGEAAEAGAEDERPLPPQPSLWVVVASQ